MGWRSEAVLIAPRRPETPCTFTQRLDVHLFGVRARGEQVSDA